MVVLVWAIVACFAVREALVRNHAQFADPFPLSIKNFAVLDGL